MKEKMILIPYDEYEELISLNENKKHILYATIVNEYWNDIVHKSIVTTDEVIKELTITTNDTNKAFNNLKRKYNELLKEKSKKKSFFNIFK